MDRKRRYASQPSNSLLNHGFKRSKNCENIAEEFTNTTNGRAGRILRVYLRNFMCHSSLEIDLNPNTNFVVGRNGSGKSAILTALIMGLGGKARLTNRGTSMKGFIKVGQTSGSIEITISNTGPMAYNPKVFGHAITIIRTFSETSNTYKLKSSTGQTVSTAFRELSRLVETLNIQVDNPVCILNQDVARTFLNSNDPAKKYIMFMKATNLENVKQQNTISKKNRKLNQMTWKAKNETLKKLEREVMKALEKYNAFQNLELIETRKKELDNEAVWAQINAIEQELHQKQRAVEEINKDIQNYTDLVKNKGNHKKKIEENIVQIEQQLLEIRNEEEANQSTMNGKRLELAKLRETMVTKKSDITTAENKIKRKATDKRNIEDEINNSSEHYQQRLQLLQKRDQDLASFEHKLTEITKLIETGENDLSQTQNALKRKQQEQSNLNSEVTDVTAKVKHRQAKIRSMRADENNSISVYGGVIQKIVQSIKAYKEQFIKAPKGPLGSYIKLKDSKWALAVEDFISSGTLMSFCVDNQKDAKLLANIFNDVCGGKSQKPTIINSKFYTQIHNYAQNKVIAPQGCIALIDALIISDPVITNCLIDQMSIENILLISNNEAARQLMSVQSRVPKNCYRGVTLNGDQFYPDPNYRCYSCRNKNPRYLQVSAGEVIRMYEEELKNYMENQKTIEAQLRAVSADVLKLSTELQKMQSNMYKYELAQRRCTREISDLKLQHVPPEQNIKILAEEMEEISKVIERKHSELEKIRECVTNVKSQITNIESVYVELKQTSKNLVLRMNPLVEEMNNLETKLKQLNINAKFNAEKINQCNQRCEQAKRDCVRKESVLKEKTDNALALGPRFEAKRHLETVLTEIKDIDQQIADARASMGDRHKISETYIRMQQKYDKTKEEMDTVKLCLDKLKDSVEARSRHFMKLSEYIGIRVREMFIGVLKMRLFKGTIEIDHENQTLDMIVYPQHGSAQGTGQTHILSGGERSYSTVAFLHALWQVMEYPFYFLDEFDVFMDKVNRRIVMDILIEHATEHADLQFVFLTPQDISGIVENNNIAVYKMADPDRKISNTQG